MTIGIVAWYEIKMMIRLKYVIIIQFLMPLLLIFILGSALSDTFKIEDRPVKPVLVDIVQQDKGTLSGSFSVFLNNKQLQNYVRPTEVLNRELAVKRLKDGTSEFVLVIPPDFSTLVMSGQEAHWEMIPGKDYGQNLTAQIAFRSFLNTVNQWQALSRSSGPEAALALQKLGSLEPSREPASLVKVSQLSGGNDQYSAMQYYAVSMLVMFLLYSGMSAAISLQTAKDRHTLSRLNAMPVREYQILLGKLAGNTLISLLQAAVIIATTRLIYGVDWGRSYLMLCLVCFLIIVASMSLAVIVMMLSKSSKSVTTLFQMIILTMTFLSGGFTPLQGSLMHTLGKCTINHWGMQSLFHIMRGSEFSVLFLHAAVLSGIGASLLVLASVVCRKVGYHE